MKTRILVAVVLLPIVLVILLFLPPVFVALLMTAITAIAAYELMKTAAAGINKRVYIYPILSAAAITFGVYLEAGEEIFRAALFLLMALLFLEAIIAYEKEREFHFSVVAAGIFGGAVIPYMLSVMVSLKMMDNGEFLVLLPFVSTMISDSGAYFVGVFMGKHKAFKRVSPKKTIEGCVGGLVCAMLGMLLYGLIVDKAFGMDVNYAILLLYGLCGNVVTQIGDLAFSLVKRQYGVKDYGNLLPGHGGMLDRFDSLVFAAPVIYMLVTHLPAF